MKILDSVRFFGKMADFINFEADDVDDVDDNFIDKCDPDASDNEFIGDETQFDDNVEDCYAMQCRALLDSGSNESKF